MIDAAAARGVYRDLACAEIGAHLQRSARRYDLIAATDGFSYVGDLEPVFAGVQRVLQPQGIFAFTVELAGDAAAFELRRSGRYAHSARYLRELAARHGFDALRLQPGVLREEQRHPIDGLAVVLRARGPAGL
jgi:predicted TPR repeat methyltransferase